MKSEPVLKLSLENFQAHSKASLEFYPGVTLITGNTSSGKTSVMRAVWGLCLNPSSAKHWILHGEKQFKVKVESPNFPASVSWGRNASTSFYQIGDSTHDKAGRSKVTDIIPNFPMLVDLERNKVWHFHTEKDYFFPFSLSPPDLFRLFEDVFQVSDTASVLKLMKQDAQSESDRIKTTTERKSYLEELGGKLNGVLQGKESFDEKRLKLKNVLSEEDSCEKAISVARSASKLNSALKNIGEAPDITPMQKLPDMESSYGRAKSMESFLEYVENLSPFEGSLESFVSLNTFERSVFQAEVYEKELAECEKLSRSEIELSDTLSDLEKLESLVASVRSLSTLVRSVESVERSETEMSLDALKELSEKMEECYSIGSEYERKGEEIKTLEEEKNEIETSIKQFDVCPLCGKNLNE